MDLWYNIIMRFLTYTFLDDKVKIRKKVEALVFKHRLYIKGGAMEQIVDKDKGFSLNSLDAICLIKDQEKIIGWAAIITGYSQKKHKDLIPSYPHLGVFIIPKYRRRGIATKAVEKLISKFYNRQNLNQYSFKEIGYSDPKEFFEPILNKLKVKMDYNKAMGMQKIEISF